MALKSKVAHGLRWQAINIVGRQLLSLLVFTTLARLLDPTAFGLVGLVGVYLGFIGLFAEQGIGTALIQRAKLDPEHLDSAFWFNLGCASFLCLSTIIFSRPIARMLGNVELAPLLSWSSLGLVLSALSTIHSTLFVKAMDFRRPTIRMMVANIVGGVVGVGMAFAGYGVWALVIQQLIAALAGTLFLWVVSDYRPSFRFSGSHLRDLFAVSSSNLATTILWYASSRLDQVVIGRFAGPSALGLYVIGCKIPEIAKTITHEPLAVISLPAFSQIQDDNPKLCQVMYDGMELNATISFAVFVGYACIASNLMGLAFGDKWFAAGAVSSLLSLLGLVYVLQVFFHPALLASGGAGKYALLNALHAVGSLCVCLIGIRFSVAYLVVGLIAISLIISIPALYFLKKRIGLSPLKYCRPCFIPLCASLVMFGAIELAVFALPLTTPVYLILSIKVLVGAVSYLGFLFIFNRSVLEKLSQTAGRALGNGNRSPSIATN